MAGLLSSLLAPSSFVMVLFAAGIVAVLWRAQRLAVRCFLASGITLAVFSSGATAVLLLSPLEYAYPVMRDPGAYPAARTIVVLTAYASEDPDMAKVSRMNASSAFRVLETAALSRQCPDCRLIVSGATVAANVMAETLLDLGVPRERLLIDAGLINTLDSATSAAEIVGREQFFLLTSGGHMPRALALFRAQGLEAIPVPTDHQLPRRLASANWGLSPFHLQASDLAVHEYIALLWYRLRGRL